MPSQAKLTANEKRELLTYHRAKQARERTCPDCKEALREAEQQCYWCEKTFSEEEGVLSVPGESLKDFVNQGKALTPEEQADKQAEMVKAMAKQGVVVLTEDLKVEDLAEFKRAHGIVTLGDRAKAGVRRG